MPDRNQSSSTGLPPQQQPSRAPDEQQGKLPGGRRQKQAQLQQDHEPDDTERVEIGDPVPEDDRTVRARGQGETGEDEDLPSEEGDVERTPRH